MARRLTPAHLAALRIVISAYANESGGIFRRLFRDREATLNAAQINADASEAYQILSARRPARRSAAAD